MINAQDKKKYESIYTIASKGGLDFFVSDEMGYSQAWRANAEHDLLAAGNNEANPLFVPSNPNVASDFEINFWVNVFTDINYVVFEDNQYASNWGDASYQVVTGCFKTRAEAENFINNQSNTGEINVVDVKNNIVNTITKEVVQQSVIHGSF